MPASTVPARGGSRKPRAPAGVLDRLLGLHRGELGPPISGRAPPVGGHRAVRPAAPRAASLYVCLGVALHVAESPLASPGRGSRARPPGPYVRHGGEPPVVPRHPDPLPALPALQMGVQGG